MNLILGIWDSGGGALSGQFCNSYLYLNVKMTNAIIKKEVYET